MGKFKNLNTKGTVLCPDLQNQSFSFHSFFFQTNIFYM